MVTSLQRRMAAFVLATVTLTLPSLGFANEGDHTLLRKGVYDGIWHTDPVTFIIEKIDPDGSFQGEMHFDPNGRWGDVRCGVFGQVERDGSLTVTRADCPQTARTGRPERRGKAKIWKGDVKGADFTSTFELTVPEGRR